MSDMTEFEKAKRRETLEECASMIQDFLNDLVTEAADPDIESYEDVDPQLSRLHSEILGLLKETDTKH